MSTVQNIWMSIFAIVIYSPETVTFAADTLVPLRWGVNSFGTPSPDFEFRRRDPQCLRAASAGDSLRIASRRGGDVEAMVEGTLEPGLAYEAAVWLRSSSAVQVEFFFRRDDAPYETTAIRTIPVRDIWRRVELRGIHATSSRGSLRVAIRSERVTLCLLGVELRRIDPALVGEPQSPPHIGESFFGVHLNKLGVHNGWPKFNPGTIRLWDTGTTWANLQPSPVVIDWKNNPSAQRLDYYIRHINQRNPKANIIFTAAMTPSWAAAGTQGSCNSSSYGAASCSAPVDLSTWRYFIRDIGYRYRDRIRIWEIWNEADIWYHWIDTPEKIMALVQIAREELHAIDPGIRIIGPNVTDSGLRFLSRFIAAGGAKFIDGISVHSYIGRSPELSAAMLRNFREMLDSFGLQSTHIWNTEAGVSCNSTIENCALFTKEKADRLDGIAALARGVIGNAALGVQSMSYYTWEGAELNSGGLPLVQPDYNNPTSASRALNVLKSWLVNSRIERLPISEGRVSAFRLLRGTDGAVVLWNKSDPTSSEPLFHGADAFGISGLDSYQTLSGDVRRIDMSGSIRVEARPILLFRHGRSW